MTLKWIHENVNEFLSKKDVNDIWKRRIFVHASKKKIPNVQGKSFEDFGISASMATDDFKKSEALYDSDEVYNNLLNNVLLKISVESFEIDYSEPIDMVKEFRETFGLKIKDKPSLITKGEYDLHYKLLREEIEEYMDACEDGDKKEVLDALVDIQYVLLGAVLHHGIKNVFLDAFKEVHASNMSKLENGEVLRREDGKIMKGSGYFKPDLERFI